MDAISEVTGVVSKLKIGEDDQGVVTSAMRMPGVPRKPGFLTTFGKPNRLLVCECERSNQVSLGQSLAMTNGVEIRDKISANDNRIDGYLKAIQANRAGDPNGMNETQVVEDLFIRALCRPPSERESRIAVDAIQTSQEPRGVLEDLLWALLNSKEFMMLR